MRRHAAGQFSVERVFRDIVRALPEDVDISVAEVPCPSRGVVPRLRNLLFTATQKADVVHVAGDVQYCALAVVRARCLLTVLDLVSLRRLSGWRRRLVFLLWYRLPVWRATAVTTISEAVRDELVDLLPAARDKTIVIGCPVGPAFDPHPRGCPTSDVPQVLVVGTKPHKNVERTASALAGLSVHLLVVGELSRQQLALMAQLDLSYSHVNGVSDAVMRKAYQESSLLVFASTYEGFGLPILEAQACGTPVVTSALPPMSDVAGGAAVLVDPYDVESIRQGVLSLIEDPGLCTRLIEAGLENAVAYSSERLAEGYAELYRRIASAVRPCN